MRSRIRWASFNDDGQLNIALRGIARCLEGVEITSDYLKNIRKELLDSLKSVCEPSALEGVDLEFGKVGIIIQVSHAQAAKSRILDALEHEYDSSIDSFVLVTQTKEIAVQRNRINNPESNQTGNRITFEDLSETLGNYTSSFINIPCAVVGLDSI